MARSSEPQRQSVFRLPFLVGIIFGGILVASFNEVMKNDNDLELVQSKQFQPPETVAIRQRPTRVVVQEEQEEKKEGDNGGSQTAEKEGDGEEEEDQDEKEGEFEHGDDQSHHQVDNREEEDSEPEGMINEKPSNDGTEPLNIVLLYGDDWRHDSIGASGHSIVKTPFLDWLAKQGVRFTHNCVTTSVCWISRANMYTGQYVSRHKSEYPDEPKFYKRWNITMPYLLKKAGYYQGHVGKWHFDWTDLVENTYDWSHEYYGDHWMEVNGKRIHTTKQNEKDAIRFLRERPKDKPFMLSVCFFAPHSVDHESEQYFPQPESMKLYKGEEVEVPVSADAAAWKKLPFFFNDENSDTNEARRRWKMRYNTPKKYQKMMKNYYRLISEVDQTSSVIFNELEKQNLLDNTLVIFSTDNGLYHGEHLLAGKWYPHQESIRVPLIIKDPRMSPDKAGTLNDEFTLNIDLTSTILAAAKVKQPDEMQGTDIANLYLQHNPKWRKEFFYEHPVHLEVSVIPASTALVRKDFKYMTWPNYDLEQLFDLRNDPYELEDIADRPGARHILEEMRQRHKELKKAAKLPGPIDKTGEAVREQYKKKAKKEEKKEEDKAHRGTSKKYLAKTHRKVLESTKHDQDGPQESILGAQRKNANDKEDTEQPTSNTLETENDDPKTDTTESKNKPMNILFLYGDDWRHDSIGAAKTSIVRTPFLDWLASKGMRFTHNCVTTSVCWISRANLYTGQYVSRHKSEYPQEPKWYKNWNETMPKLLKDAGYFQGHSGKWHFDWTPLVYETYDWSNPHYGEHWYEEGEKKIHTTQKNENDALEFLRIRPKDRPFLLSVCFFAPHSVDGTDEQYFPQPESMELYENETVEFPISATEEEWSKLPPFFSERNEGRRRWHIRFDEREKAQRMMKNYYRLISEIDQTSKVIYEELERQGVLDNTLIIFTTDNGLYHSEHGLAGKWYPHQESIRVPLIIKDPRMPKNKVGTLNDDFTLNIDLASTILGAAGLKQPSVMQGRDISDLYLQHEPNWRKQFFYEHPVHLEKDIIPASTALVRKNYKYLTWPDYEVEQLFDLEKDPFELEDLAGRAEVNEIMEEMRVTHGLMKDAALKPGPIDEVLAKMIAGNNIASLS